MSEMPHCTARPQGTRCWKKLRWTKRIREFNQNLRNSEIRMMESNAHHSGLIRMETRALWRLETARKVQVIVAGCTIEVYKCIQ
jgi:hypothetical protein